jgi:sulfur-carrier protein
MIRVVLPAQLCTLANVGRETELQLQGIVTLSAVLDALEAYYPMLWRTIRDQVTHERRPFIRFFTCGEDLSLYSPTSLLPEDVVTDKQPLRIVGAMAGDEDLPTPLQTAESPPACCSAPVPRVPCHRSPPAPGAW